MAVASGVIVAAVGGSITLWVARAQQVEARRRWMMDQRATTYADTVRSLRHFDEVMANVWEPTHYWGNDQALELFWMNVEHPLPELRLTGSPQVIAAVEAHSEAIREYAMDLVDSLSSPPETTEGEEEGIVLMTDEEVEEANRNVPADAVHERVSTTFNAVVEAMRKDQQVVAKPGWWQRASAFARRSMEDT